MKKIIAITAMAAAAAATLAFAAEPVADVNVATFTGSADVTWGVDLDAGETGFKNGADASIKVNIVNGGDKSTEGDGVWAELKVKTDGLSIEKGGATNLDASVDTAKLHFGPVYLGIQSGDTVLGEFKVPNAVTSSTYGTGNVEDPSHTQGVVLGYNSDLFDVAVDFRSLPDGDNYYTNDYGAAGEVTLKFVPGLEIKAGADYQFDDEALGIGASEKYTLSLGEKFKLIEGVGFTMGKTGNADPDIDLAAGVVFAWGDEADDNAGVPYLRNGNANKVTPGIGVAVELPNITTPNVFAMHIAPSFYSGDLIPNLKIAALGEVSVVSATVGGHTDTEVGYGVAAGVKYNLAVNDAITISPYAGARFADTDGVTLAALSDANEANSDNGGLTDIVGTNSDNTLLNVTVGADVSGLINNTTFSAYWTSRNLLSDDADDGKLGTINLKCSIAF